MEEMIPLQSMIQRYHRQLFSPPLPGVQVCSSREAADSSMDEKEEEELGRLTENKGRGKFLWLQRRRPNVQDS